jgi:acyl-CoA synthetase (AMP-forming)/AMP-acid ligase II
MRPACRIQPNLTPPRPRFGRDFIALARNAMFSPSPKSPCALESVSEMLWRRAGERPNQKAFVFLAEPSDPTAEGEVVWTYGELDRRARAVAAALGRQAAVGDRAVLVFPPGLEFLAAYFGCLYAGVLPVPAQPPRRPSGDSVRSWPITRQITLTGWRSRRCDSRTKPASRAVAWIAVDDAQRARPTSRWRATR